mgnify:CR=1 FL=1
MAYVTENNYTGDNSTVLFSFTFPYLEKTDVKVSIDQVDTTAFTFANATQIQLNSASGTNGKAIRIYRDTNIDNLKAEFFSGSAIRSEDLNEDFRQTLYSGQESEKAVELKWNKTTETLDSTEAFIDSDSYLMTAKAIDDRIGTNIGVQPIADGKILVGNGSGVGTAVTPSGDVTMSNTGAFTIASTSVENGMIANDAINGNKIADDAIDSEHIAADSIDTEHYAPGSVDSTAIADGTIVNADISGSAGIAHSKLASLTDGRILVGNGSNVPVGVTVSGDATLANTGAITIANDAVEQAMVADDAIGADQLASAAVVNDSVAANAAIAHTKLAAVPEAQIIVGNASTVPTAVAISGDVTLASTGAVTIANDAIEIGMIGCEQTTISDSDSHIPTSGAVVDYVTTQMATIGGLDTIATDAAFPNSQPQSGIVISIADAGGLVVNGSGVSTTGRTVGGSTVTINGINSSFHSTTISNGVAMMVESTGSGHIYNYHKATLKESDLVNLSSDINDFGNRYRVGTKTADNASSNDDGDLFFDTGANKMYVYDGAYDAGGAWKEVTSAGDYKLLTIKDHDQAVGGSGPTFNGSNEEFDLFDGSSDASISNVGQLIVSLNGVIQKPNSGTFSGSEEGFYLNDTHGIKFCDPPPSGSSLFVTQIGTATTLSVPADDSVTSAKIVNGAIVNADINAAADIAGSKLADDSIAEVKLDIHNAPSGTDKFLKYTSNGMEWAVPSYTTNTDTNTNVLAGGTITGDVVFDNATHAGDDLTWDMSDKALEFDDNVKATFGDGSDLQIYANGSTSIIDSTNQNLDIQGSAVINIKPGDAAGIVAWNAGAVELHYNAVKELATKSGGVKLFGHSESIVTAVTSASSVTLDFSLSNHFSITMGHNIAFGNPTTESVGQSGTIVLTQDGTGSRTASWGSQFLWAGGTAPTLSTAAAAVDRIDYFVAAADKIHCVASLGMA